MRPLLLLDVDGPFSSWAASERTRLPGYVEHRLRVGPWRWGRPLRIWLNPNHGPALVGLAGRCGAELAWVTSWDHRANEMIGPAIGLPVLAVVEVAAHLEPRPGFAFRWKFGPVARYAAGRQLAWLDDDFDVYPSARDEFVAKRQRDGLSTELISVDPRTGITDQHRAQIENLDYGLGQPGDI